ncbi:MAG: SIMPL domain-containing protein [Myxococcota bacterium]
MSPVLDHAADTITVRTSRRSTIDANSADLYVTVQGSSFMLGRAVLDQSRQVRELVEALADMNVPASDIFVEGVRANVKSGFISKSTTANYKLRVHCAELDALPAVMDIITDRKDAELTHVEWRYPDSDEVHDFLLRDALPHAKRRAEIVAEELDLELLGVHDLEEELLDPENEKYQLNKVAQSDLFDRSRAAGGAGGQGIEVVHRKDVTLKLEVQYRVQPLETGV